MPVRPERVWRRLPYKLRAEIAADVATILAEVIHDIGAHQRAASRPPCGHLHPPKSSPHQVLTNQESLRLQYDLRRRARALGWREEDIEVIDSDLGLSGVATAHREGFKDLIARVTLLARSGSCSPPRSPA